MSTKVRTVYIELRASAEKLRADMAEANASVITIGKSGEESGKRMAHGMDEASGSVRKLTERATEGALALRGAYEALTAAAARYGGAAVAGASSTENIVNTYRALRIALSPTPFTIATVATGVLAEETLRLVSARAKLIQQQSLIAAREGISFGATQRYDAIAGLSGGDAGTLRSLSEVLNSRLITDQGSVGSGLGALGLSADEPDLLSKIAAGFASIEDPARRAAAAVNIFGAANAEDALKQLNAGFAESSDAVGRYGLVLDSLSTQQIYKLRHDIDSLTGPLRRLREEWNASGESAKNALEEIAGAAYDGFGRALFGLNNLLDRIPALSALQGFMSGTKSLSPNDLSRDRRGMGSSGSAYRGETADYMFADAQLAEFRKGQTLEGREAAQKAAQDRADAAYKKLTEDAAKREFDPHDSSLMTPDQRFSLANEQQAAAALAASIGETVAKMKEAAEAQKQAAEQAKELATFQAGATDRLDVLYQSTTLAGMKDQTARAMYEGQIDVRRDADKTTDDEKSGRAAIATQRFRQVLAEQQQKWSAGVLDELAKANSFALEAFGRRLAIDTENKKKGAEDQVKEDAAANQGLRDSGEHAARMASIRSGPGDDATLAKEVLDIRLKTVEAERAIVDAHLDSYTAEQGTVEMARLDREQADAELTYRERIEELLKQRSQEAIAAGGAFQQNLRQLQQQVDALNSVEVTESNVLDLETARKAINDKILEVVVQQKLAMGDVKSGWDAFWISMQEQAEKPGKILYDGMHAAVDGLTGDLAKVATGHKGGFGKTFESVGQGMVKESLGSLAKLGLGKLGGLFGIHAHAGKPDGSAGNPYYVIVKGGAGAAGAAGSIPGLPGGSGSGSPSNAISNALKSLAGKAGGFFGKLFGDLGSVVGLAGGGDADPGQIYRVAEAGEGEFITPKNASTVTPLSKMTRGETHYHEYMIDARGADLGAENRVSRAIEFAHNAAVTNSVRASAERMKRTPQRSHKT